MVSQLNNRLSSRESGYEGVQYLACRATLVSGTDIAVQIGQLPIGAVVLGITVRVITAFSGGTPVLGVGLDSAHVGGNGQVLASGITNTAQTSTQSLPLPALVLPIATDQPLWFGSSGSATAGDAICIVTFSKPIV